MRGRGNRDSAPALGGLQIQKGVEFLKRDLAERTLLFVEPIEELLGVPASVTDCDLRQTALLAHAGGEVLDQAYKRKRLFIGRF